MITKYNFYDGIPVGIRDFQEFFDGIKRSSNAALMFAFFKSNEDAVMNNTGGYLEDAPVVFRQLPTGTSIPAYVLSGDAGGIGTLFLKSNGIYDTYEVPYVADINSIPTVMWEVLATSGEKRTDGRLYFEPNEKNSVELPIRVIRKNSMGAMEVGLSDLRYNGIPQNRDVVPQFSDTGILTSLQFSNITLGAEYPYPVVGGKFLDTSVPNNLPFYINNFNSKSTIDSNYFDLMFPYANFINQGAVIIVRRVLPDARVIYQNIAEDMTPGRKVKSDCFKVIDRARGIIRLNLTSRIITQLKTSAIEVDEEVKFEIVCPEILMEEVSNNVIYYRSRYGGISYAASTNAEILRYVDGGQRLEAIPVQKLSTTHNDVIMYEKKTKTPSTILAIKYQGEPDIDVTKQANKYYPDVFSLFYTNGVITNNPDSILGVFSANKTSWYNWDANVAEYNPVHRVEKANIGLILEGDREYVVKTGKQVIIFSPRQEVRKEKIGLSDWVYVHEDKRTLGVKNEFVRRDANIPEPHHINPPMTKMILVSDELLHIPEFEQMKVSLFYQVESRITVDGFLIVD